MSSSSSSSSPLVPTDTVLLYTTLFKLCAWDLQRYKKQYKYLVENHRHTSILDRSMDIQYEFCVLWESFVEELWTSRKNVTRSLPFPLYLPLRHELVTNSYFIYYIHQLHFLCDSTINTLAHAMELKQIHKVDDFKRNNEEPDLYIPYHLTDYYVIQYQLDTNATIRLVATFLDTYIDASPHVFLLCGDKELQSTLHYLRFKYHLLRVFMCWLYGQSVLHIGNNIKNPTPPHKRQQEAVDMFESGRCMMIHVITPLKAQAPLDNCIPYLYYAAQLERSCAIDYLLIRAKNQIAVNNSRGSNICMKFAMKSWGWVPPADIQQVLDEFTYDPTSQDTEGYEPFADPNWKTLFKWGQYKKSSLRIEKDRHRDRERC